MATPTNKELAHKLRIIAKSTSSDKVKKVLLQSADRLEKPGHKADKKHTVLYTIWDNRTDQLIAVDLPEKDCLAIMKIGHAGFMAALRRDQKRWKIEKRFADEIEE